MTDPKKVKEQSKFCKDLMTRLDNCIQGAEFVKYYGMEKHTARQDEIIRLRRELMLLSKMLNPWDNK